MKHAKLLIALLVLLVSTVSGCAGRSSDQPPTPSPDWVQGEAMAVRLDQVRREPHEHEERLVTVRVEATVRLTDSTISPKDLAYSLDFGDYTIGPEETGTSLRDGQPLRVHALFTLPVESRPKALLIRAKETTLRIPLP